MASDGDCKVFNRGTIIIKLYKNLIHTNRQLKVDRKEEVNYEILKDNLNRYLREDQEITANELILVIRNRDPLLTFMILISLALGIHMLSKEEVKKIFVGAPDTVISPLVYKRMTEDYNTETTTNVSYYDTIHTFNSGIKTLIPKKFLEEIQGAIQEIEDRRDESILPPPKMDKNDKLKLETTYSKGGNTFSWIWKKFKLPKAYTNIDNTEDRKQRENIYSETITNEQNYAEVTAPSTEKAFHEEAAFGTSTPKNHKKIYPNLEKIREEQKVYDKIETRFSNFNEENLAIINKDSLNGKVKPTDFVLPITYKADNEYRSTFEYFRNRLIRVKYILKTPIITELIFNLQDRTLQDTLVQTGRIVDDTINDIIQESEYTIIEETFTYPPLNLTEDTLFTLVVLPQLTNASQRKLCIMLNWVEKLVDLYYYKINQEYVEKSIEKREQEKESHIQAEEKEIMIVAGNKKRCEVSRRRTKKEEDHKKGRQLRTNNNRRELPKREVESDSERETSGNDGGDETDDNQPQSSPEESNTEDKRQVKIKNSSEESKPGNKEKVKVNGVEASTFIQQLQMLEKLIKIHEPHIPKFDGTRTAFIKFIIAISNRLEQRDIPQKIKIELTKHFMIGAASSDIEGQEFPDDKWETFKQYLVNRYILDKRATLMELRKDLDNLDLGKSTINEFYMKIKEKINLLTFLDPVEYKDTNKIITQKLLAGIPSNYYYRLKTTTNTDIGTTLAELEKIENLERSLAHNREKEEKYQDPALRSVEICQVSKNFDNGRNYQNNYKAQPGREYDWRKLPCRLHGPGHTAGECKSACGYCLLKGSHTGENCWRRSEKINEFVEKWIQKHGVAAKTTAESFIKADRIIHPTEEEFERRLRGNPRQQKGYEGYKGNNRNDK